MMIRGILKISLAAVILTAAQGLFSMLKFQSVISDMTNSSALTDGDYNTAATGRSGTNVVILQIGNLKYVRKIKVYFSDTVRMKKISVYSSENFIEWSNIIEKSDIRAAVYDLDFVNVVASFLRIEMVSDGQFAIREIEVFDEKAPSNRIIDLKVTDIGENTAVIRWRTPVKSQSTVVFEKKYNGTRQSLTEAEFISNHSISLKGLLKGSEYLVHVVSVSPDGSKIESGQFSFFTKGVPLPEFWELKALNITPFTAKISYRANVPVRHEVRLGRTERDVRKTDQRTALRDTGELEFLGLQPETRYFYQLVLKDRTGNVVMTPVIPFETPAYNIALGKKAAGTFNFIEPDIRRRGFGDTTVDRVVDGNLNYFGGMALSFNADFSDQYVVIDLEKREPIKRVDVYWWGLSFSKKYRIDVSDDGSAWTTVRDNLDAEKGEPTQSPGGDVLVRHMVPIGKTARLVRLYVQAKAPRGSIVKKWDPRPNLYLSEIAVIRDMSVK